MEYSSAIKRNEVLICGPSTWMNLKNMRSERSQTQKTIYWGFPGGAVVENLPANAGDTGSSPGLGRSHMPRSN